jgi:hypothetical protein
MEARAYADLVATGSGWKMPARRNPVDRECRCHVPATGSQARSTRVRAGWRKFPDRVAMPPLTDPERPPQEESAKWMAKAVPPFPPLERSRAVPELDSPRAGAAAAGPKAWQASWAPNQGPPPSCWKRRVRCQAVAGLPACAARRLPGMATLRPPNREGGRADFSTRRRGLGAPPSRERPHTPQARIGSFA